MYAEECTLAGATRVRCPMYVWWEARYPLYFAPTLTREINRVYVFVQDLGTSVGFEPYTEPSSILSFEFNRPYYMICSTGYFSGVPACPASRYPIAYPPYGSPHP
jgi:hypothetical protein